MKRVIWLIVGSSVALGAALLSLVFFLQNDEMHTNLGGPIAIVKGGEAPKHGFLGVEFDVNDGEPLTIRMVLEGSGADDAGLRPGDRILAAASVEKPDRVALRRVMSEFAPGRMMPLKIGRGKDVLDVRVRLISFADSILLRERNRP